MKPNFKTLNYAVLRSQSVERSINTNLVTTERSWRQHWLGVELICKLDE
jgi:hypothetical protein